MSGVAPGASNLPELGGSGCKATLGEGLHQPAPPKRLPGRNKWHGAPWRGAGAAQGMAGCARSSKAAEISEINERKAVLELPGANGYRDLGALPARCRGELRPRRGWGSVNGGLKGGIGCERQRSGKKSSI